MCQVMVEALGVKKRFSDALRMLKLWANSDEKRA